MSIEKHNEDYVVLECRVADLDENSMKFMSIRKRIENHDEVSVEEILNFDGDIANIIDELWYVKHASLKILRNYCVQRTKDSKILDSKILYVLGYMNFRIVSNYKKSIQYYKMAIEKNNYYAIYRMGEMYRGGFGVEQNYDEAIKYYKLALEKGVKKAEDTLEGVYYEGGYAEFNFEPHIEFYKKIVEEGDDDGLRMLGNLYCIKMKDKSNVEEGIKYYKMAIAKGNKIAMEELGKVYAEGIGIKQNLRKAIKYYNMCGKLPSNITKTINEMPIMKRIKYYKIISNCENIKEETDYIDIELDINDIIQMYDHIKELEKQNDEYKMENEELKDKEREFSYGVVEFEKMRERFSEISR
jgi:tetratricopeptide (TPR) repeat protein